MAGQGYQLMGTLLVTGEAAALELPRFVQADISREDQVVSLFRGMNSKLGPITAIVNNAATLERQMRLEEMTADRLQRMSAANVIGSFLCSREAVKHMSTRHGGAGRCIVNISSAAARSGRGRIHRLRRVQRRYRHAHGWARERGRRRMHSGECGKTGLHLYGHPRKRRRAPRVDRVKTLVPLQRGGQPEEVAAAILYERKSRKLFRSSLVFCRVRVALYPHILYVASAYPCIYSDRRSSVRSSPPNSG